MIPASRIAWSKLDDYRGPRPEPHERVISVTSLINAPRIVRLMSLHRGELPRAAPGEDTWAILGTAVHAALEKAARLSDTPPILVEQRCETSISVDGIPWVLSGQPDVLEADGTLVDWKITSAWSVSDGRKGKSEWECQLNVLRWLLERSGTVPRGTIKGLAVWAILRDWNASQARRDEGYPQSQEIAVPFPLWSMDEAQEYVTGRLRLHEAARTKLPDCTPEERWARDAGWAVLKSQKSLRAERIMPTRQDAERYVAEILNGKAIVEERKGTSIRCEKYCPVSSVCSFAKSL